MAEPQPDFPIMAQGTTMSTEQLALIKNIPAVDNGAAILARLDGITTQMTVFTTQMTVFTNQMATLTGEIRAKLVFLSSQSSIY
jgi:hypothetical protein